MLLIKRLKHELAHDSAGLGLREASPELAAALLNESRFGQFSRSQVLQLGPVTADDVKRARRDGKIAPPTPRVSVVVPAYNAERYVSQSIRSVLDQSLRDLELIAVDDGSTDSTGKILDQIASHDPRMTVIHQANGGTGRALNAGFAVARGEYQTWWSADSYVAPHWLETLASALDAATDVGMVYSDWAIHDEQSGTVATEVCPEFNRERLQRECYLGPCWLFRRSLKDRVGPYDVDLCEDYGMHLRMAAVAELRRVPGVLGYWRNHAENLTNRVSVPNNWRESHRAQARAKWSQASIKIAYICPNIDAAGVGWWMTRCVNELLPDVAARHVLAESTAIAQLDDLRFRVDDAEIRQVLDECDLIHCNQVLPDCGPMDLTPWLDRGKPLVLHTHGGSHSWDLDAIRAVAGRYRTVVVTCTPSLVQLLPDSRWMPNPIPVVPDGTVASHANLFRPGPAWPSCGSPLRVLCHHNYESAKGMDAIRGVVIALERDYGVVLDTSIGAQMMGLHAHLEHKKTYDVVIDQLTQGFVGMAGWESLAQGAVVVARLDEYALDAYRRVFGSVPPVVNVPWTDHLAVELRDLANNQDRVLELKRASRQWALEYYAADKLLALWRDLYREVLSIPRTLNVI